MSSYQEVFDIKFKQRLDIIIFLETLIEKINEFISFNHNSNSNSNFNNSIYHLKDRFPF
jgi:hypothetical protein